jgi:hypothetical protein
MGLNHITLITVAVSAVTSSTKFTEVSGFKDVDFVLGNARTILLSSTCSIDIVLPRVGMEGLSPNPQPNIKHMDYLPYGVH